jgi:hypothetical protein
MLAIALGVQIALILIELLGAGNACEMVGELRQRDSRFGLGRYGDFARRERWDIRCAGFCEA